MEWFKIQADAGLLGEIYWDKTKNGNIVCQDGFSATTFFEQNFKDALEGLDVASKIIEINESSIFCQIITKLNIIVTSC